MRRVEPDADSGTLYRRHLDRHHLAAGLTARFRGEAHQVAFHGGGQIRGEQRRVAPARRPG